MSKPHLADDPESFALVVDLDAELRGALQSLTARKWGTVDGYVFLAAKFIHRGSIAFISLREGGQFIASRILIRPVFEAAAFSVYIRQNPEKVFQKAFDEYREDRKWAAGLGEAGPGQDAALSLYNAEAAVRQVDANWKEIEALMRAEFPNAELHEHDLSAFTVAQSLQGGFYAKYCRLYSNYTHATMQAIGGNLQVLGGEDNWAMAISTLCALTNVIALGGVAPNFESLKKRSTAVP